MDIAEFDFRYTQVFAMAKSLGLDIRFVNRVKDLLIAGNTRRSAKGRNRSKMTHSCLFHFGLGGISTVIGNCIRVEAHPALTTMRGGLYQQHRPDLVLRDDLEDAILTESPVVTEEIVKLLDEARRGMAVQGVSLRIGNFIVENWIIETSVVGAGGTVRFIPVIDNNGTISWPSKFVKTDAEAVEIDRDIKDLFQGIISFEIKRRELNAGGRRVYEVKMLLDPIAGSPAFFARRVIEQLTHRCTEATETKAGFELWSDFNSPHACAIGADTGKGNGGDHSSSVLIDFTTVQAQQSKVRRPVQPRIEATS